jgi:pimeloyl-ACP methyl ester carboxylesterase
MQSRQVALRDGLFEASLLEAGSGPPLLYLHGTWAADGGPFLERLAERRRVLAPRLPGFGESTGSEQLLDLHDLIYYELDLLDALDLRGLPLVGHSLGGMVAAELAAVQPERFSHLVLLGPLGLWNQDYPVPDFFAFSPPDLAAALYADPDSPVAQQAARIPVEEDERISYYLERAKGLAASAKYLWPIPNRGLAKRLHRVRMPTLLVWGERDEIVSPRYAADFQARLPQARLEILPNAAHLPMVEQPERLAALVEAFLAS